MEPAWSLPSLFEGGSAVQGPGLIDSAEKTASGSTENWPQSPL
jgi:hypothetical protein